MGNHEQQALFRTTQSKSPPVPCESCGSGSGCFSWLTQRQLLGRFMQRLNQSLPAASFVFENGLGILFWTAKWKTGLLTLSRVRPIYFRSIKEILFHEPILHFSCSNCYIFDYIYVTILGLIRLLNKEQQIICG